jgi:hypothetical protein
MYWKFTEVENVHIKSYNNFHLILLFVGPPCKNDSFIGVFLYCRINHSNIKYQSTNVSRKQLTQFYLAFFRFISFSGYHRAIRQRKKRVVRMLRGMLAFEKERVGLFFLGGFALSVRRRSDGTRRLILRIFPNFFPVFSLLRVAIYTSTSPRFCVFYTCMNTFNTVNIKYQSTNSPTTLLKRLR